MYKVKTMLPKRVSVFEPTQISRSNSNLTLLEFQGSFQFNLLGILNTQPEIAFYKIKAIIKNLEFYWDEVDWQKTSKK